MSRLPIDNRLPFYVLIETQSSVDQMPRLESYMEHCLNRGIAIDATIAQNETQVRPCNAHARGVRVGWWGGAAPLTGPGRDGFSPLRRFFSTGRQHLAHPRDHPGGVPARGRRLQVRPVAAGRQVLRPDHRHARAPQGRLPGRRLVRLRPPRRRCVPPVAPCRPPSPHWRHSQQRLGGRRVGCRPRQPAPQHRQQGLFARAVQRRRAVHLRVYRSVIFDGGRESGVGVLMLCWAARSQRRTAGPFRRSTAWA